jgi:hypothetical protein
MAFCELADHIGFAYFCVAQKDNCMTFSTSTISKVRERINLSNGTVTTSISIITAVWENYVHHKTGSQSWLRIEIFETRNTKGLIKFAETRMVGGLTACLYGFAD